MIHARRVRSAQLRHDQEKYFEVVILLITNHIHASVDAVFFEFEIGGTHVLGDVNRCSVAPLNQLFVQAV